VESRYRTRQGGYFFCLSCTSVLLPLADRMPSKNKYSGKTKYSRHLSSFQVLRIKYSLFCRQKRFGNIPAIAIQNQSHILPSSEYLGPFFLCRLNLVE
jgi:hypothetical protein